MSLSVDADPDNELGQLFTQKALFTCDPEEN
jgi:tRNA threonylcarbamoyladenosine biosynthesis protein TsaE